jgi:hypothetical protein
MYGFAARLTSAARLRYMYDDMDLSRSSAGDRWGSDAHPRCNRPGRHCYLRKVRELGPAGNFRPYCRLNARHVGQLACGNFDHPGHLDGILRVREQGVAANHTENDRDNHCRFGNDGTLSLLELLATPCAFQRQQPIVSCAPIRITKDRIRGINLPKPPGRIRITGI